MSLIWIVKRWNINDIRKGIVIKERSTYKAGELQPFGQQAPGLSAPPAPGRISLPELKDKNTWLYNRTACRATWKHLISHLNESFHNSETVSVTLPHCEVFFYYFFFSICTRENVKVCEKKTNKRSYLVFQQERLKEKKNHFTTEKIRILCLVQLGVCCCYCCCLNIVLLNFIIKSTEYFRFVNFTYVSSSFYTVIHMCWNVRQEDRCMSESRFIRTKLQFI